MREKIIRRAALEFKDGMYVSFFKCNLLQPGVLALGEVGIISTHARVDQGGNM